MSTVNPAEQSASEFDIALSEPTEALISAQQELVANLSATSSASVVGTVGTIGTIACATSCIGTIGTIGCLEAK